MYAVTVTFTIAPDRMQDFLPLMLANAETSLADEPGCRQFDVCTDPDLPDQLFLYEIYDDRAAFDAHLQSDHFRSFDAQVAGMIADKAVRCWAEVR